VPHRWEFRQSWSQLPKPVTMPTNHSCWLHDGECLLPSGPDAREHDPKRSVDWFEGNPSRAQRPFQTPIWWRNAKFSRANSRYVLNEESVVPRMLTSTVNIATKIDHSSTNYSRIPPTTSLW